MSAALASPPPLLRLDDLRFPHGLDPKLYDLTLARALGFDRARNIRRLIKSNRAELETYGALWSVVDHSGGQGEPDPYSLRGEANRPAGKAGRPGRAFYLNEGQSLVICALTRTPAGARVRGALIRVFMLHRTRRDPTVRSAEFQWLVPAERRALRAILAYADIVLAPPAYRTDHARDGVIPYIVAPLSDALVEAIAAFETEDVEQEDGCDAEPSEDDEPGGDVEPSLGSLDAQADQTAWSAGSADDRERDDADDEPSLGSLGSYDGDHLGWASGISDDRERDEADIEPSLGALNDVDQRYWANLYPQDDREVDEADDEDGCDAEASFAGEEGEDDNGVGDAEGLFEQCVLRRQRGPQRARRPVDLASLRTLQEAKDRTARRLLTLAGYLAGVPSRPGSRGLPHIG